VAHDDKIALELNIPGEDGHLHIRMKRTMKFSRVYDAIAHRLGKEPRNIRMCCDGSNTYFHVSHDATPAMYEMEDGDVIDVMVEQTGC